MSISISIVNWETYGADLSRLRVKVFVEEQDVPLELEVDDMDSDYKHAAAFDSGGALIGTGRLLPSGKIGRMAVLSDYRNQGVGRKILDALVEQAKTSKLKSIYLDSQLTAVNFYKKSGFVPQGEIFLDAGIEHITMTRNLY
ncbi:MAG: GNAT family N-acetyltransferase [Pseudomonadota bacterium]